MDKALEMAVVSMGTPSTAQDEEGELEEQREEEEEKAKKRVKWLHEFVTLSLPGSRHQV